MWFIFNAQMLMSTVVDIVVGMRVEGFLQFQHLSKK